MRGNTTRVYIEGTAIIVDRLGRRRARLNGQVNALVGMGPGQIGGHADIRDNHRIDTDTHGVVDGASPDVGTSGGRKRIDCRQDLCVPVMGVGNGLGHLLNRKIETGKIARVGRSLKSAIDGIRAGHPRPCAARRVFRPGQTSSGLCICVMCWPLQTCLSGQKAYAPDVKADRTQPPRRRRV